MKRTILVVSVLAIFVGLFWIGQGLGYIQWPPSSFMISQRQWSVYGSMLVLVGLLGAWFARR